MALIALVAAVATHYAGKLSANGYHMAISAAVILLIVLSVMSHVRTYAFKDNESIIRDNVANNPGAWAGHNNLGDWTRDHNQHEEALAQYREAVRLFPQRAQLNNNIGLECIALGRADEAVAAFEQALRGALDDGQQYIAHFHLFKLLSAGNRAAEARQHVEAAMLAAVRLTPDDPQVREDAGATLLSLGKLAESEENLRRAIELKPTAATAHQLLGELLALKGDRNGAVQEFQAALAIDPKNAAAAAGLRKLQVGGSPTPK
jgi:tetratricopeptide (TPR) repeat protein